MADYFYFFIKPFKSYMNEKLINFHLSCKDEYFAILEQFNILFYGYGSKENVLSLLFPDAFIFNMRFSSVASIITDILEELPYGSKIKTLKELDKLLEDKKIYCILNNFDFSCTEFQELNSIKIIGTVENLNFEFTQEDLIKYNFIFRDLTTFENYNEDIVDSEILDNKIQNVKLIIGNLSAKPKFVFKELLKIGNCTANLLFNNVKKSLFLSKIQSLIELLREFTDHKIIKITGNAITVNLTILERESIAEYMKDSEF